MKIDNLCSFEKIQPDFVETSQGYFMLYTAFFTIQKTSLIFNSKSDDRQEIFFKMKLFLQTIGIERQAREAKELSLNTWSLL